MNWLSFLPYALITTFTPGPNNIMAVSIAAQNGVRRTLPFNLGVWAGFTIVIQLSALLGSRLYALLPSIKTPMLFIGAAYLLYLAWKTWKSKGIHEEKAMSSGFLTGLLMQFINPKGIVYALVSMETFVLPYYHDQYFKAVLVGLFMSTLSIVSTTCWASFGSLFKLLFSRYGKTVNAVLALLLLYCAVSLFL